MLHIYNWECLLFCLILSQHVTQSCGNKFHCRPETGVSEVWWAVLQREGATGSAVGVGMSVVPVWHADHDHADSIAPNSHMRGIIFLATMEGNLNDLITRELIPV